MQDRDWLCGRLTDRRVVQTQFGHHLSGVKAEVPGDPRAFLGRRIVLRRGRERDQRQNHHTYCSVGKNVTGFSCRPPSLRLLQPTKRRTRLTLAHERCRHERKKRFRRASLLEARRDTRYRATGTNPCGGNCCCCGPAVRVGCITFFTTYSPILSPISVPARVEKR